jgi:hypothetical protein
MIMIMLVKFRREGGNLEFKPWFGRIKASFGLQGPEFLEPQNSLQMRQDFSSRIHTDEHG